MSKQQVKFTKTEKQYWMMFSSSSPNGLYGSYSFAGYRPDRNKWCCVRCGRRDVADSAVYFRKKRHAKKALKKWGLLP